MQDTFALARTRPMIGYLVNKGWHYKVVIMGRNPWLKDCHRKIYMVWKTKFRCFLSCYVLIVLYTNYSMVTRVLGLNIIQSLGRLRLYTSFHPHKATSHLSN